MSYKIVWVNGCFDVLHRGHIELFKYAKSLGDYLVVGIDSDKKITRDKGPGRPINNVTDRVSILKSIRYVDSVCVFDSYEMLSNYVGIWQPDVMVVGSDWRGKPIIGGQYAKKIEYFDRIDNLSSTNIINALNKD